MAKWLKDGEVLLGQGSGETLTCTPRQRRGALFRSPRPGESRSPRGSPSPREGSGTVQPETMGKAREMFVLCDKEGKGFITKRDMQRLQRELPLSPEQLESVFESLDRENNGFLTPIEFNMGLGDLMGSEDHPDQSLVEAQGVEEQTDCNQNLEGLRITRILRELGADKLFKGQRELCTLWMELQRERPDLLGVLEQVLAQAVTHLQDSLRERDCLEQALRRREGEHDQVVQSIYEEMESQIGEERQKHLAQDSIKQWDRIQQLQEELKARELELDSSLSKQKELEKRIQLLSSEQAEMKEQSRQLQGLNLQLQEQLETSREDLNSALAQLNLIQSHSTQEHITRQSAVLKVSKNMQKEKDSLLRQLEMLRDMNKRLRDEKDAHQSQKRTPNIRHHLQKKGSIIGNYLLRDKTLKRQLSSSNKLERDKNEKLNTSKRQQPATNGKLGNYKRTDVIQTGVISPQRVFKVVFLGNSGVGKSSFIQHYCTGHFPNAMSTTVGIDFQMRCVTLGFATIILQLWDTAGQERFRSITQQYYRKADGILIMYDVTNLPSFTAARGWMECLQERTSGGAVLMLLGNKLDMADSQMREVTTKQGHRLVEQYEADFYVCSAKTGYNMEELMTQLARLLSEKQDQQCGIVMAVGVWTIMEKSDYISLLHNSYYSTSAYILIASGAIVVVTGILGCCATLKEMRSLLIFYFILLLCVFLLETAAGVLSYINYQELDDSLKANLKETMVHKYQQPGEDSITQAVDRLQQEFKCCGSNSSTDWSDSAWIQAANNSRVVPDSCCKTPSDFCGSRDHPSNIYRVEGGCIIKLEDFILRQLYIISGVGIGIAFLQLVGMMFTCCLYRNLKEEPN